jgi:hypothetical protein
MNDFQISLRDEIQRILNEARISSIARPVSDPLQVGDALQIEFGQFALWIYADGANVEGPQTDKRFELPDFDGLDELRHSCVRFVELVVAGF